MFACSAKARRAVPHSRGRKAEKRSAHLDLTGQAIAVLRARKSAAIGPFVFSNRRGDAPLSVFTCESQHSKLRLLLKMSPDFVIHSLRHTMLSRLGKASPDPYLVMKIAGHSTIAVSQRYVHPSTSAQTEAFERLEALKR
jgi:integrase